MATTPTIVSLNTFNGLYQAHIASEANQYYGKLRGNLDSLIRQHFTSVLVEKKEDTRAFNMCEFPTDPAQAELNEHGLIKRCGKNIIALSALVLDVDDNYTFDEYRARLLKLDCKFFGYTTFSNSTAKEKFRFVVPFHKPLPKAHLSPLKPLFLSEFDCDGASFSQSQAFFFPSHSKANAHLVRFEKCNWDKECLNWEEKWDTTNIDISEPQYKEKIPFQSTESSNQQQYSQDEVYRVLASCSGVKYDAGQQLAFICRSYDMSYEQYCSVISTIATPKSDLRNPHANRRLYDSTENWSHTTKEKFQLYVESHGGTFDPVSEYDLMTPAEKAQFHAKRNPKKVDAPLVEEDKVLVIPTGKKLSDIADKLELSAKNTLLVSPTGSGKSHYVAKVATGKRIMVVPNVTNIENMVQTCNHLKVAIKPFYSGHNEVTTDDELIITTYDSLSRLFHKLNDCDQRTVFMDETHVFISNSSKEYKHNAHLQALSVLDKFHKIVQLTATPLFHNIEQLKAEHTIVVVNESKPVRIYQNMVSECVIDSVVNMVAEKKSIGEQSIVYLNNTQEDKSFGKLTEAMKMLGLKVACVNSKTRGTDDYIDVIVDGDMSKVDVVVATVVLKEGVSIEKHSKNVNIFTIGAWHPVEIEQMANRPRNADAIHLFLAKKSEDAAFDGTFDKVRMRERISMATAESAKNLQKAYGQTFLTSSEQQITLTLAMHGDVLDFNGNEVVVDQMLLANKLFNMEKNMAFVDNKFMEEELAKFGWAKSASVVVNEELDEGVKKAVTEKVKLSAEQKKAEKEMLIEAISKTRFADNCASLEDVDSGRSVIEGAELNVRRNFDLVASVLNVAPHERMTKVAEALEIIGTSKTEIARFKKAVVIDRVKKGHGNASIKKFIGGIYEYVEGESRVTAKDVCLVVNECYKVYCVENKLPVRTLTQTKCSELFSNMIEGKKFKTKIEGKDEFVFEINGLDALANVRHMISAGERINVHLFNTLCKTVELV